METLTQCRNTNLLNNNFFVQDDCSRTYSYTDENRHLIVRLFRNVIDGLARWNAEPIRSYQSFDRRYVEILLVAVVGIANIRKNKIDPIRLSFIKGTSNIYFILFTVV